MAEFPDNEDKERLAQADPNDPSIKKGKSNQELTLVRPAVGLALATDGTIFKTRAADKIQLRNSRYADLVLTKEELKKVNLYMGHLMWGINSVIPVTCTADACPFKTDCPYWMIGKAPIGKPCLVEEDILDFYTEEFGREYGVDENSPTERLLVQELAELLVYEMRATRVLARAANAEMTQTDIIGFDSEGEPIKQESIHRAWELKERCKSRRMKILDALVGTRREQYKKAAALKEKGGDDVASMSADLSTLLRELKIRKSREIQDVEVIEINERKSNSE